MKVLSELRQSSPFDEIIRAAEGVYSPSRLLAVWAVVLLGFCLAVSSSWRATPDAALYLELGESLARGTGYAFNGEPHTYVSPGYPAIVAAVARVFGGNFLAYRILMALAGLLTAAMGYLLVLRMCGRDVALLIGGVFVLNHELLFNATCTTTDVPFALVTLAGLNAVIRAAEGKRGTLWTLVSGLMIGLTPLVRINGWGIPPAAALFLYCAWTDRARAPRIAGVLLFFCTALLPAVIWELYKATFPVSTNEGTFVNAITGRSWYLQISIILDAAWGYVAETTSAVAGVTIKTGFLEFLIPILIVVGAVTALTRRERLLAPLAAIQFCGLLLSPAGARYLVFLLPALYLFLALGLLRSARSLSESLGVRARGLLAPRRLLVGVFVLLGILNAAHNVGTVVQARTALETSGAETERDLPFFAAARWIRARSPQGVVMSMHPRVLHYLSGIRSVELIRSGVPESRVWVNAPDEIRRLVEANHVTLLFTDNKNKHLYETVTRAVRDAGIGLEEIPEASPSPRFKLWKLVPQGKGKSL
jgi:hypothetical protein